MRGVGNRSAPHAAVYRVVQGTHVNIHGDETAQCRRQRRQPGGEVLGVGQHQHIGVETVAVAAQEVGQVRRSQESVLIEELERNAAPARAVIGELIPGEPGSIQVTSE